MRSRALLFVFGIFLAGVCAVHPAVAQDLDAGCVKCHKDLSANKVVHAPMKFGCVKCHSTLDVSVTPHKNTGQFKGGLVAKGAEQCYSCHDKKLHAKKSRHTALSKCLDCHAAHSSKHEKLLTEDAATLCYGCHERKDFEGKFNHEPVAEGSCTACHDPHAADQPNLLAEAATKVCMDCHKKVKKSPHATTGFAGGGHPLGGEKPGLMDPARPDQPFYCGSCHDPHRGSHPRLLRFDKNSLSGFCQKCHNI